MAKHIDAEKLKAEIKRQKHGLELSIQSQGDYGQSCHIVAYDNILSLIDSLQQEQNVGELSDGYHTFNELYYYRMLYNAAFFNLLPKGWVHKSKKHHTGEECFGGGWFIVMANLPNGQVSNHYELKDWGLFKVTEKEVADEWDGHTPQEAAERLYKYLQQEEPEALKSWLEKQFKTAQKCMQQAERDWNRAYENGAMEAYGNTLSFIGGTTPNQENDKEQPKVDLEKFTEKMNDWKARFDRPDDIPIKATMAFTARMFYMYPKVAKEWYESLPKATQD